MAHPQYQPASIHSWGIEFLVRDISWAAHSLLLPTPRRRLPTVLSTRRRSRYGHHPACFDSFPSTRLAYTTYKTRSPTVVNLRYYTQYIGIYGSICRQYLSSGGSTPCTKVGSPTVSLSLSRLTAKRPDANRDAAPLDYETGSAAQSRTFRRCFEPTQVRPPTTTYTSFWMGILGCASIQTTHMKRSTSLAKAT